MSTTYTTTGTETVTWTQAREVAGKVASDMRQFARVYGRPSDENIATYLDELTTLLSLGYVERYKFGFQRDGQWVLCHEYRVVNGMLMSSDRPGGVTRGIDTTGARWVNHLACVEGWYRLPPAAREQVLLQLPFRRTVAQDGGYASGFWEIEQRTYAAGPLGLTRRVFRPL